jgi:S-adenosylmethionine-diacylglycerol 3-amino-3-carboxypropyl transferase
MTATDIARATEAQSGRSDLLKSAVHRHKVTSRLGLQERVFTYAFSGLVYPQIWEDPAIDLEALKLKAGDHLVAIASGGCNILSYVTAADAKVTGIDLNPAHVALNKLKLCAIRQLPDYTAFHRFFAEADSKANIAAYTTYLAPHLDAKSKKYWDGRDTAGRRRIGYFATNVYAHGLLGNFIRAGHLFARMHGRDPRKILSAKNLAEQRQIYETELKPLFDKKHIKWVVNNPSALFGLGIPPSQFKALKGNEEQMATVLKARLERLACGFDLSTNYFAWQAFGKRYRTGGDGPLPPYLMRENFETLRQRVGNVSIQHASFTDYLAGLPAQSCDAYSLLDAQDWMTDEQLNALWREIVRTSRPGARVIFRTAGEETILPGRLEPDVLSRFAYDANEGRAWTDRDRSSIYGGFHCYTLQA